MVKKVIFNGEQVSTQFFDFFVKKLKQRSRRFSYDDQTVMIAEFLQEWCDRNNKLVLVSYDAQTEETDVNYKLKLEIFGFKKIFTQTSGNISDALNQVSKQAINFLLRKGYKTISSLNFQGSITRIMVTHIKVDFNCTQQTYHHNYHRFSNDVVLQLTKIELFCCILFLLVKFFLIKLS